MASLPDVEQFVEDHALEVITIPQRSCPLCGHDMVPVALYLAPVARVLELRCPVHYDQRFGLAV